MAGYPNHESAVETVQTLTIEEVELFGCIPPKLAGLSGARELATSACVFGEELGAEITPVKILKTPETVIAITQAITYEETPETDNVSGEVSIIEADGAISTIRFTTSKEDLPKLYTTLIGDKGFQGVIPLKERFGSNRLEISVENLLKDSDPSKYATSFRIESLNGLDAQVGYPEKLEYLWNIVARANGIENPPQRNFLESLDLRHIAEDIPQNLTLLEVMLLVDTFAPYRKISAKQVLQDKSIEVEYHEDKPGRLTASIEFQPVDDQTDSAFTGATYDIRQEIEKLRAELAQSNSGQTALARIIQRLAKLESLWEEFAQGDPAPRYEDVTFETPDNATVIDFAVLALKLYKLEPSTSIIYFESAMEAIDRLIQNKIIDKPLITMLRTIHTQVVVYSFLNSEIVRPGKDSDLLSRQIPLDRKSLQNWLILISRSLRELKVSHESDLPIRLRQRFVNKVLTSYRRLHGYFGASSKDKKRIESETRAFVESLGKREE